MAAVFTFILLVPVGTGLLVAAAHVQIPVRACAIGQGSDGLTGQEREAQECVRYLHNKHAEDLRRKRVPRAAGIACELVAVACLMVGIRWAGRDEEPEGTDL